MRYLVISSGSKGNCTLICSDKAKVLLDCGISKKKLLLGLSSVGVGLSDIDAMLISHSHSDHTSGLRFVPSSLWMASPELGLEDVEISPDKLLFPFRSFTIKDLSITPLPLSHDAPSTLGFLFKEEGGERLVYITDTGFIGERVISLIAGADYYIFESNHDTRMLFTSNRTASLISRIHSDCGHMDNLEASTYLSSLVSSHTKEVTLAHLSEDCNTPQLAEEAYRKVMLAQLGYLPHALLRCASISDMVKGGNWGIKP